MRSLPQESHADLGLVPDDNTPDMRKAPAATEALQENHQSEVTTTTYQGNPQMTLPAAGTVPVPQLSDIALMLDTTVNMADLARGDLSRLMPQLPERTSLWVHVDLVRAIGHLRQAAVLLDKATDQLDVQVVQR